MKNPLLCLIGLLATNAGIHAQSTMDPTRSFFWDANIGWVNARPDANHGLRTDDTFCSGFLWSGNVGWIHTGDGTPANGQRYANTGGDYGVNVMTDGTLRGFAWCGNIGWVNFENSGNPRIDFTTGRLTGHAWSGNTGWINLGDATFQSATTQIAITDSDRDGISDAWEYEAAGNLTTLANDHDADHDGVSDFDEFLADTDPGSSADRLAVSGLVEADFIGHFNITFPSLPTRLYRVETSTSPAGPWVDSGYGWFQGVPTGSITLGLGLLDDPARFFRVAVKRPLSQ